MKYPARRRLPFADDELAQICRDLPESACREQPRNYVLQVLSLSLTRIGEGFAGAKLVLAWLLDAIGAPTSSNGLLVPVRESLAMLPQLLISARIRQLGIRWIPLTVPVVAGADDIHTSLARDAIRSDDCAPRSPAWAPGSCH